MSDKQGESSNDQVEQRRQKLAALREQGNPYPNDFRPDARAAELLARYEGVEQTTFEEHPVAVAVAGRMMTRRVGCCLSLVLVNFR